MRDLERILSDQISNKLGESPLWSWREGCLYWVDMDSGMVYCYHPATAALKSAQFPVHITALGEREAGGFIVATDAGFGWLDFAQGTVEIFYSPETDKSDTRLNDGAVDPSGGFVAGMKTRKADGGLYRISPIGQPNLLDNDFIIANGMGWSLDRKSMYMTDSSKRKIYVYDFDLESGEICNRRVLIESLEEAGVPDGLTVDADGFIWSARWGGWKIQRYDPEGILVQEVKVPVECPTSLMFGGDDLDQLYITSCRSEITPGTEKQQPDAGGLFRFIPGVRGVLEPLFKG